MTDEPAQPERSAGIEGRVDRDGAADRPLPRPVRGPSPSEWSVAVSVVAIAAIVVGYMSRGMWFYADVWDFLANRRITNIESIMRPHFGHWQVPAAIQGRILYAIAGMDFWPVHQIARALAWGLFSLYAWWIMRRGGADRLVAMAALAIISVLGTSFYFQASHVGALVAVGSVVAAALLVEDRVEPNVRDRFTLFGLLLLAVMSAGIGVASVPGVALGLLLIRRVQRWLAPLVAVLAVYGIWFVAMAVSAEDATEPVRSLVEIPGALAANMANVLVGLTGVPTALQWPLLAAGLAALTYLAVTRRLSAAQVVVLSCTVVYLALVSRNRLNASRAPVATNVLLMLAPVFVPMIRPTRAWIRRVTAVVLTGLLVSHGLRLETGLDERIAATTAGRPVVESIARLIGDGEPFDGTLRIRDLTSSSQLTLDGVSRLVAEGWAPPENRSVDEAALRLRVSTVPPIGDEREGTIDVLESRLRPDGCAIAFDGAPVVLGVDGAVTVTLRAWPPSEVVAEWTGPGSSGSGSLGVMTFRDSGLYLFGVPPDSVVTLRSGPGAERLVVCGIDDHLAAR